MTVETLIRSFRNRCRMAKTLSSKSPVARILQEPLGLIRPALCALVLAASGVCSLAAMPPLYLTNSAASPAVMTLAWNPSPDGNVSGYFVCWGLSSTQCTNRLDAGPVTNAMVAGFTNNTTYYFSLVAYDALGQQADPSNQVQYSLTNAPIIPTLGIQPTFTGPQVTGVRILFQAHAGTTYTVLATQDFAHWNSIWTAYAASDGPMSFQTNDVVNFTRRFYRLLQQ